jgi:glycosyltransferase involved in cell wall biosynthesis
MSVLGQWGNFRLEIVVGDDASSDNTVSIVQTIAEQYPNIIRLFAHSQNMGPSKNLNFTISQTQGDFIAHLDGDDFWLPGKLQTQLDFLQANMDCPACYTNTIVLKNDKSYWGFFNPTMPSRISLDKLLTCGNFINSSSLFYRAIYKQQILEFPEKLIDYRIHLFLALNGHLGYINQVLVAYRINSSSSQLATMHNQVLYLYVEALLVIQPYTKPKLFKDAIRTFYRAFFLSLYVKYDSITRINIITQLQRYYPLNWVNIVFKILPYTILSELKNWLYKKTSKHQPQFLQRNGSH